MKDIKRSAYTVVRFYQGNREVMETFFDDNTQTAQDKALEYAETQPQRDLEKYGHNIGEYSVYSVGDD